MLGILSDVLSTGKDKLSQLLNELKSGLDWLLLQSLLSFRKVDPLSYRLLKLRLFLELAPVVKEEEESLRVQLVKHVESVRTVGGCQREEVLELRT